MHIHTRTNVQAVTGFIHAFQYSWTMRGGLLCQDHVFHTFSESVSVHGVISIKAAYWSRFVSEPVPVSILSTMITMRNTTGSLGSFLCTRVEGTGGTFCNMKPKATSRLTICKTQGSAHWSKPESRTQSTFAQHEERHHLLSKRVKWSAQLVKQTHVGEQQGMHTCTEMTTEQSLDLHPGPCWFLERLQRLW